MTDIEWGAEIAVNGVRPEWLRDEDIKFITLNGGSHAGKISKSFWDIWTEDSWHFVAKIFLPATHPYYLATSRGFTYWPGGESAPADWDGSPVLLRDGEMWAHSDATEWQECGDRTVIGYRKRTEQPAPAIAPELVERMVALVKYIADGGRAYIQSDAKAILAEVEPDPDLTLAKSIVGDAEAIALAIKAARENGR